MKILVSDFDNTIYYLDDKKKNQKNVEAIKRFVANGNIFCIITGRNYVDLKKLLVENNIFYTYLICDDGAKIFNNMDYCIETVLLDEKDIENIVSILEDNHLDYYLDDGYSKTDYVKECVKVVVNCTDEEEKKRIVDLLRDIPTIRVYASRFHVNIISKSVNKENAIKKLFNLEELDYNLLHVIGDNDNDYEMLKAFDGAVMREHHPILDSLEKKEYNLLKDYIDELLK